MENDGKNEKFLVHMYMSNKNTKWYNHSDRKLHSFIKQYLYIQLQWKLEFVPLKLIQNNCLFCLRTHKKTIYHIHNFIDNS